MGASDGPWPKEVGAAARTLTAVGAGPMTSPKAAMAAYSMADAAIKSGRGIEGVGNRLVVAIIV